MSDPIESGAQPEPQRFPLVRDGDGWTEVAPQEGVRYEAYREICSDDRCPFTWPGAEHSHITPVATVKPIRHFVHGEGWREDPPAEVHCGIGCGRLATWHRTYERTGTPFTTHGFYCDEHMDESKPPGNQYRRTIDERWPKGDVA